MAGEFLRPDVFSEETQVAAPITGSGISTGGMVGVAERGPVGKVILTTSFADYSAQFGSFFKGNYLTHSARAFFREGGTRLYISRVAEAEIVATLQTGVEVNDNALLWTSVLPAGAGNDVSITLTDAGGATDPLVITVVGTDIDIQLETVASTIVTTADQLKAAILADSDASALVTVADFGASDGSVAVVAEVLANLSGGLGASTARRTYTDMLGADTYKATATSPGAWGNKVSISSVKYALTTTADVITGATEAEVSSLLGIELGDVVFIDDGTTSVSVIVSGTNVSTGKITFPAVTLGSTIVSGAAVLSGSNHRLNTRTNAIILTGATEATVTNASNARVGQVVTFTDGTTEVSVDVTEVNGSVLSFDAVTLGSSIAANAVAVSQEFQIAISEGTVVVEVHNFLSFGVNNIRDYIGTRLGAGDGNQSAFIELDDLLSASADPRNLPVPASGVVLVFGLDGAAPGSNDFIGSEVSGTGIFAFDALEAGDVNFLATPGITAVTVTKNGDAYAQGRGDIIYIADVPESSDTAIEALDYRNVQLNIDSSYTALYYPWLVTQDPESNLLLNLPPSGFVMGEYSNTAARRGVHKAPANVTLEGVLDVTHRTSDGEHDVLNPAGINVIKFRQGEGIRIMGARTLQSAKDGKHYVNVRNLLNFVKTSITRSSRFALFESINEDLFTDLRKANTRFLKSLWVDGALFPSSDASRAFFVKVDSETTPQSAVDQGQVFIEIGINPVKPAEFIVFRISLFDGEVGITESSA